MSVEVGQNVLVKPVFHMPGGRDGQGCRVWTHLEFKAARVESVSDDGKSARVEYLTFQAQPCSCDWNKLQTSNMHFVSELVTGK